MGNGIQTFFGDRLSAGGAFPESAIGNSLKRSLNRPDFHQPGISKTLQNLITFTLSSTFLEIGITRLTQFRRYLFQPLIELMQPIAQTLLEMLDIFHGDCLQLPS